MKVILIFLLMLVSVLNAQPTTKAQAKEVVTNWLRIDAKPLSSDMHSVISSVVPYAKDAHGYAGYFVVSFKDGGFVVVSGDDLVEPIVAFSPNGKYVDSLDNPMGALVKGDLPNRVSHERDLEAKRATKSSAYKANSYKNVAKDKWDYLSETSDTTTINGVDSISDERVTPFLQTEWNQRTESGGEECYNLYTPNNYPSGCVATAFAQVLNYFEYPTNRVGTTSFDIKIDGTSRTRSMLGGDGSGGAYNWSIMSDGPTISDSSSRTAIGRLMNDTGVSVNMSYRSGGSGTNTLNVADSLTNTFSYSNAIKGYKSGENIETTDRNNMINPNLDAGLPVVLGITDGQYGHAILSDGYGYDSSTLYNHLNMGWGGSNDAWYNLPDIINYNSVYKIVYNIYTTGSGEIISGRVLDSSGNPVVGADVTATGGYTATTNTNGIYALTKLPSSSTYTVDVSKSGYSFSSRSISTSTSSNYQDVGNRWGVNFTGSIPVADDKYEENDDLASASNIVNLKATWVDAIQADDDWYKVYVSSGSEKLTVELSFTHADGDIDVTLYDESAAFLGSSSDLSNTELIEHLNPTVNSYYYIQVYYADAGNSYQLRWDDGQATKTMSPAIINYILD